YVRLANSNDFEKQAFIRDLAGSSGSLRTYSSLESFKVWPVEAGADDATMRVRLNWSSAVGPLDDVRDLEVKKEGNVWKVVWPKPQLAKVPPQVIPVNYLRWDVLGRGPTADWGFRPRCGNGVGTDGRAMPVPAGAAPVIAVSDQTMDDHPLGKNVLRGGLADQSGQRVNLAQVLAD